ncbi:hypothetical protein ACNKHW_03230 [Shigella flexneri]
MKLAPKVCALCWKRVSQPMIMRADQALYAITPIKNPFSGVRLTADMMRFVGAVA